MSEENRPQQSSAESTVAGAAKTGKAIASIAKGAATGGAHGAAVEAAKSSKKWIIPIVAVILLPVLIIVFSERFVPLKCLSNSSIIVKDLLSL